MTEEFPPAPLLWDRAQPDRCACGGAYRPLLNARGTLVKKNDPAWSMAEQRSGECVQEHFRRLAGIYRNRYQHHLNSRGSGAGYPDVHLWTPLRDDGGGGSAYCELKRMGKNPTPVQCDVMATLQDATPGGRVYLCRACCLFTYTVDQIMADLAGRPNLMVGAGRAYTPVEIPAGAPITRPADRKPQPARTGPVWHTPDLPGTAPVRFAPATGVVVPMPASPAAHDAMLLLEAWLRASGFTPMTVPYPVRLVLGIDRMLVHCRQGLARPGSQVREWRTGVPAGPFPGRLIEPLNATMVCGPDSDKVAEMVTLVDAAAIPT